tara:strand:- start:856 stop:1878 length:1023 start_codon:yes stop_codon:yes gene_type:complete
MLVVLLIISIFLVSCSTILTSSVETSSEDKEALYGEAIFELNQDNSSENANLDRRYELLSTKLNLIIAGQEQLNIADFTRIKIELDFLQMSNYDENKTKLLENNFMLAYNLAGEQVEEEDYSGMSLSDRYYSLNKSISDYFSEEVELSVAEYIQLENGIKDLTEDSYPVPNKIDGLRNDLVKVVLAELESAIVNFEIPIEEEIVEEVDEEIEEEVVEVVDEELEEVLDEVIEEVVELTGPKTVIVKLIDGGFDASNMEQVNSEEFDNFVLNINVNDTVEFRNVREGNYKMALLVGNRECSNIKSGFFNAGESFEWTFNETGICWISDAIFTTQAMKIIIS